MKEIIFFTGYHGSGKTYTATKLSNKFGVEIADCGPIIRKVFNESGMSDFDKWVNQQEHKLGGNWDDILIIEGVKAKIKKNEKQDYLFVVGNRRIRAINLIKKKFSSEENNKILFFERPFLVMKSGYENRTKQKLTDEEFLKIIQFDEELGLLEIKKYVELNPKNNNFIKDYRYSLDSIELAEKIIFNKNRQ